MNRSVELLSPAGDWDALIAAVESGADLELSQEELKQLITVLEQQPEPSEEPANPPAETTAATEETTVPTEETTAPTTAPTKPRPTTPPATQAPESDDSGDSDSGETAAPTTQATQATEPPSYTVTFTYNGTFATQTVKSGEKAAVPKLQPTASGSWAFDFNTAITGATTITWNAQ